MPSIILQTTLLFGDLVYSDVVEQKQMGTFKQFGYKKRKGKEIKRCRQMKTSLNELDK